jgi:uncharacterized phage protein (TIGR01671 family)
MEIKFRGQRIDNNEWVFGYYVFNPHFNRSEIISFDSERSYAYEIIPETLSQFICVKDKYGKEIYKGDLLKRTEKIDGNWVDTIYERFEVISSSSFYSFEYQPIDGRQYKQYTKRPFGGEEIEIIGNVYQNPELIPSL